MSSSRNGVKINHGLLPLCNRLVWWLAILSEAEIEGNTAGNILMEYQFRICR